MAVGFVSLVGAGPGDPDLLTVKAVRRLRQADVVLHDALIDPRVLRLAERASRQLVGGRVGACHNQDAVNRLLVELASSGSRVVRLKGGDPFVFGRGGEEARALVRAGVPFEVVPGVSSVTSAPALAGIPLTHRGISSGFAVITGHDEKTWSRMLRGLAPGSMTLVVLMGLGARRRMVDVLASRGWPRWMPAAVVLAASTPRQRVWRGTLAALADVPLDPTRDGPGVMVIGEVTALAEIEVTASAFAAIAQRTDRVGADLQVGRRGAGGRGRALGRPVQEHIWQQ
jgi:uroporphyrin-III C-methyltransferase/precorrin-2 dehydrogenase/sirohydrochlorin ferrochelatase